MGLLAGIALIGSGKAFANLITTTGTGGLWSAAGTWAGGVVPGSGDDVTIADGATVTTDGNISCISITIGSGTSGILQLSNSSTAYSLTISSNFIVNSGATLRQFTTSNNIQSLYIGGNFTVSSTSMLTIYSSSTKYVYFYFNNTGLDQQINGSATAITFYNLALSNTNHTTSIGGSLGTITVSGTLTLNQYCILDMGTAALVVSNNTSGTGTIKTQNISATPISQKTYTGEVVFNSTSASQTIPSSCTFMKLTNSNTGGTLAVAGSETISSGGTLTMNDNTTLDCVTSTLTVIASNFTCTGNGTLKSTASTFPTVADATWSGTISLAKGGGQTLKQGTYNNVTFSVSSSKAIAISTTVTINGTLSLQGSASCANSGTLNYGSSSTLEYATTAGVTATANEFPATNGPANLKINTSGQTFTLPASFSRTLIGTLNLAAGTLATGANTLTLKGSISGSGTINTSTTGTLAFGGTSEQTLAAANLTSGAVNVLTVNANAKLTTTGSITATTLNILNDGTSAGTGTLKDVSGTLTASSTNVTQFISGGRNWYLSSPVTGATGTGVIATSTATTKPIYFDWYDESKGSAGWTTQASTLTPALGYVAINSTSTPSTDGTLTFSGALNTGSIPVNLTTSSTTNYVGYNLVGNPFPAYLDISNLAGNSNLVASYWYRTYKSGGYVFDSENLPSGLGTSLSGLQMTGKIPPLQAFWLLANNAYSFSFSSANCVHQDNTNNKFRAPSTANAAQQVLRLQVSNGINSDEAIIYSNAAASNTYDAYDTPKMSNNNAAIPEIATIIDGQTLVINGFNTIPVNTELPLLFSTAQQNSFSIKASQFNNFDAGTQLILKDYADPVNPILTDISAGNSYTFSSGITTNNSSRFALIFKAPSIATAINEGSNDKVWISINVNKQIMINGKTGTASVTVYNALGQKLYSNNLTSNLSVVNTSLCSGVYVVTLTTEGKSISKKVIID